MTLLVSNIKWSDKPEKEIAKRLNINVEFIDQIELLRRSVDARKRPPVWTANYKVVLKQDEDVVLKRPLHGVRRYSERDKQRYDEQRFAIPAFKWPNHHKVVVVGAGPAGLFAALRLAEAGASAILLERGGDVKDRHRKVKAFWRYRRLDEESNVVYGEGGAGAFSDGKIYTRKRDGELGWVFKRLIEFGADPSIMEEGWAHLGTDKIREILPRMRQRILELGVDIRFHTKVQSLIVHHNRCVGVRLDNGEDIESAYVFMATGHSARDSWEMMLSAGAQAEIRPIRIGARIEHPQSLIDLGRYGQPRDSFPPASYRLVHKSTNGSSRGAHTFCMCPGGTVVPASNHEGRVVVNGMSYSGRKAWFANSAVIVQVEPTDYPSTSPLAGVLYQDKIEQKAFELGGGDYRAPAQRVSDFLVKKDTTELPKNSYPQGLQPSNLWEVFPNYISEGLRDAILSFERKIAGFSGSDGVLIAPETRTTAPLRFKRDKNMEALGLPGMFPIGEGAGYAGGIASAALEGFFAAEQVIQHVHAPVDTRDLT